MFYVWHNLYLATIWYHVLLLLVYLHHANCIYFTWLHPFLTASRLFLFSITTTYVADHLQLDIFIHYHCLLQLKQQTIHYQWQLESLNMTFSVKEGHLEMEDLIFAWNTWRDCRSFLPHAKYQKSLNICEKNLWLHFKWKSWKFSTSKVWSYTVTVLSLCRFNRNRH